MYEKCWKLSYWSQRLGNITQFKVYLKYSFSQTHMHLDEQVLFLEKVEHMVWFYGQKTCLFLCCANGLPLTPFTLFFPCNTSAHTHTCPQHFTPAPCSIMNIFMSGRVLREIPCIKLNTLLSCLSDRYAWRRHWKTTQDDKSWTADCSLFFSPLRKGKKKE